MSETEQAVGSVFVQLREGLSYIRAHREIRWSLIYLGIAASLVGVLGVLGPNFAETTLGLKEEDFVVVVLPLGIGIVMGILLLNAYGRLVARRRVIEGGLVALGVLLALMAGAGRISAFLTNAQETTVLPDLSLLTSLLSIVVGVAFFAGIAYAFVAIPSQTQLQEDLPEDVRGRVFGVLNMLVSVASFLPILVVGPIADLVGTTIVLVLVATAIGLSGVASILVRGPLKPTEAAIRVEVGRRDPIAAALGAEMPERGVGEDDEEERDPNQGGEPVAGSGPDAADEIAAQPTAATSGSFAAPVASADPAIRGDVEPGPEPGGQGRRSIEPPDGG